jgi:hypothetical protein
MNKGIKRENEEKGKVMIMKKVIMLVVILQLEHVKWKL